VQLECDELVAKNYSLDLKLTIIVTELAEEKKKSARFARELLELSEMNRDDKELYKLRQLKSILERKVFDQEKELDEQAGTIQQLEQMKLKLEMGREKLRQQRVKELGEKDKDLDELKGKLNKRVYMHFYCILSLVITSCG